MLKDFHHVCLHLYFLQVDSLVSNLTSKLCSSLWSRPPLAYCAPPSPFIPCRFVIFTHPTPLNMSIGLASTSGFGYVLKEYQFAMVMIINVCSFFLKYSKFSLYRETFLNNNRPEGIFK